MAFELCKSSLADLARPLRPLRETVSRRGRKEATLAFKKIRFQVVNARDYLISKNTIRDFMKKTPDIVIFGRNALNEGIDYGYVRKIKDDNELIDLLRLRLKVFFIDQVQPLQNSRSAFPLTTMTCIGIETLGKIFVPEQKDDTSYQFVEIIKKNHQVFGRKPNKKYHQKLIEIWSEKDLTNIDSFGKIIYRFFRNTMIHGYQAKGVFLSYEDTNSIKIDESFAFVTINPDWFWNSFKDFYEKRFAEILNAQDNNNERKNCLKYIKEFLLE